MSTTTCKIFKGKIENYLRNGQNNIESRIDSAFSSLKFKTWLCKTNIIKKDGYHASHLLFILMILPLLKVKSVHSFCKKHWQHFGELTDDQQSQLDEFLKLYTSMMQRSEEDRRQFHDPEYTGPDRRNGIDRRDEKN